MRVQEKVPLAGYTTFGIGGPARFFTVAEDETDVLDALRWAEAEGVKLFVLGGGSNLLVADEGFDGLVLRVGIAGIQQSGCSFAAGAGENWDSFVSRAVQEGCAGVECLAGIPGSVGGTPVQNVGAYGQDVSETIASVRALDRQHGVFVDLSKAECHFRYRESLFNKDEPGRYIVTTVRFELRQGGAPALKYADLQKRFQGKEQPTLHEVAAAVREIRREKGMVLMSGEQDCRSAGSFFKNPVVEAPRLAAIAAAALVSVEAVPRWPAAEGKLKLPAAWLLERAGFLKGYGADLGGGHARVSSRHTLALTNWSGEARCADVHALADEIATGVKERFGVQLEREPVLVG